MFLKYVIIWNLKKAECRKLSSNYELYISRDSQGQIMPENKVKWKLVPVNSFQNDKFKTTFLKTHCGNFRKIPKSSDNTWKRTKIKKCSQEIKKNKYKIVTQRQYELIAFWFSSESYFFFFFFCGLLKEIDVSETIWKKLILLGW